MHYEELGEGKRECVVVEFGHRSTAYLEFRNTHKRT
jgi:hypothetical protein